MCRIPLGLLAACVFSLFPISSYAEGTGAGKGEELAPLVEHVYPRSVSVYGGDLVIIQGYYFDVTPGATVTLDGVPVAEVSHLSGGYSIEFITPAHAAGTSQLTVTNADGQSGSIELSFDEVTVEGVTPNAGSSVLPNTVSILGKGFGRTGMRVTFGGVDAVGELSLRLGASGYNEIRCTTPTGITGPVDVVVYDKMGGSSTLADGYTFLANTAYGLGDSEGSYLGGDRTNVNLQYYDPGAQYRVRFGDVEVAAFYYTEWNSEFGPPSVGVRCITPPHAPGLVDVTVFVDDESWFFEDEWNYVVRPENDQDGVAIPIAPNDAVLGDNSTAVITTGRYVDACSARTREVFYELSSLESGVLSISLCADSAYNIVSLYNGFNSFASSIPSAIACGGPDGCPTTSPDTRLIVAPIEACTPYYIGVATEGAGVVPGGPFLLETDFTPDGQESFEPLPNDEPAGAESLEYGVPVTVELQCASRTPLASDETRQEADLWYVVHATQRGRLTLATCPLDPQDTQPDFPLLEVYDAALQQLGLIETTYCNFAQDIELPASGNYYVRVVKFDILHNGPYSLTAQFPNLQEGEPDEGLEEGIEEGVAEGVQEGEEEGALVEEGEGEEDGEGSGVPLVHDADSDGDFRISFGELLRVIQLRNASAVHCAPGTEDGFAPGAGETGCAPHTADYAPQDWGIALNECLRVIQMYNAPGYFRCNTGEDGYCI
jgi:hypothetical protein